MSNKRTSSNNTPYKVPQSKILFNGARNDYPAFWNRFLPKTGFAKNYPEKEYTMSSELPPEEVEPSTTVY
jgi:hypothetical protein